MSVSSQPPTDAVWRAYHWLAHDPARALDNYTWINNVTLGACHCRFAFSEGEHCLTRHMELPFSAIAVEGCDPIIVRELAAELLPINEPAYSLVPERIANVLEAAIQVLEVRPEWQMLYQGGTGSLDVGAARRLTKADLPAMMALAEAGVSMVFSPDTFARGEFFGVENDGKLAAMGGVQTRIPGMVEIGSIATHPDYRRQGHASQVVAALIRHLIAREQQVFLCLFQTNGAARALYEKLGFKVINELQLIRWQLA